MSHITKVKWPPNKNKILDNVNCPYCGLSIDMPSRDSWDKDHVIGRRFVPRGTIENQWNIQVNAHKLCNNRKSNLEDDISAISIQPDGLGIPHSDDEILVSE